MDSRRQKKIGQMIQDEMGAFLQREGANYYGSRFVTVTDAQVTPDLQVCRIFVSVLDKDQGAIVVEALNSHIKDIRKRFGNLMRRNLRIIPDITFYLDDTLDQVFRLEEIFKQNNKAEE